MKKQNTRHLFNERGDSLVMVLIAVGLSAVIASVIATISTNAAKSSSYVAAKYDNTDLLSNISQLVAKSEYCPTALNSGTSKAPSPIKIISNNSSQLSVDLVVQNINGQTVVLAEKNQKISPILSVEDMYLEYQKDKSNKPIAPEVNVPSAGQTTHHMNLVIKTVQGSGVGSKSFAARPIPIVAVTDSGTGKILECQSTSNPVAQGAVIWSKTLNTPSFPMTIDVPQGTRGIRTDISMFQVVQLPGDKGRTVGSRFSYATNSGSGVFAISEIGAGNNNGAQARFYGTTGGVIPVGDNDTKVTISRVGYLLDEAGNPMAGSGAFMAQTIMFMGLDKGPEAPPPQPPPTGPINTGGGGGGGFDGCFVAGTAIQMADGSEKKIEDIKVGDKVYSWDEVSDAPIAQAVTKLHHHKAQPQRLHEFHMEDGEVLVSNSIHPIFVQEMGNYNDAAQIYEMWKAGGNITFLRADGALVKVKNIVVKSALTPVFNFEVEGRALRSDELGAFGRGHNYFADGFLVHNAIYGTGLGKTLKIIILGVPSYGMRGVGNKP